VKPEFERLPIRSSNPGLIRWKKLDELRNLDVSRLTQLRELLANPSAIHEARSLLAEQVGKFTLQRVHEDGKITFKANGKIDFSGEEALTRLSGAGGPSRAMQSADSV
jgi:hypothetical protein